jgi:hypothetical protein
MSLTTEKLCEYCGSKASVIITKIMQPSMPHDSCKQCAENRSSNMMKIRDINSEK